jgi:uncharacterized protein YybS (DUF2232 family)
VSLKQVISLARAAMASALMFLVGGVVPFAGGVIMIFAPGPLLGYAVGFPHALARISVAALLSAALIAAGAGFPSALAYLISFGLAAALMCYMLERQQSFEWIVAGSGAAILLAATVAALVSVGSPVAVAQTVQSQLAAGITHGERLYKMMGVNAAIAPDTQAYVVDTITRLAPALAALMAALTVLLNLAVFWRVSGKQQRIGYALFPDLARWSAPEWLIWPLLVSGFGWFIPLAPLATIALDCFVFLLAIYFCQGLAIMAFYFKQLGMPPVARGLIYLLTLVQPFLTALVGVVGVFDLWADFRRLKRPNAAARNLSNFL